MGTREGLMHIYLDCWERGEMNVGGMPSAVNFAKRKLRFVISLVNAGVFCIRNKYLAYIFILVLYLNCN